MSMHMSSRLSLFVCISYVHVCVCPSVPLCRALQQCNTVDAGGYERHQRCHRTARGDNSAQQPRSRTRRSCSAAHSLPRPRAAHLHEVVLHDVADNAVLVKVAAATLRTEVLLEDDLHVVDIVAIPATIAMERAWARRVMRNPAKSWDLGRSELCFWQKRWRRVRMLHVCVCVPGRGGGCRLVPERVTGISAPISVPMVVNLPQ
eukprot:363362-Chlamydomonas_euryale.AAC.16